eukprot:6835284-Alexandrium_andersonii.AAC.1
MSCPAPWTASMKLTSGSRTCSTVRFLKPPAIEEGTAGRSHSEIWRALILLQARRQADAMAMGR